MFSLSDPDPYDAKTRCPIVISLAQKVTQRKQEHAIGFRIYQVRKIDKISIFPQMPFIPRLKEISTEIDSQRFFKCLNYIMSL